MPAFQKGHKKVGGRKLGTRNKATQLEVDARRAAAEANMTPVDFMLGLVRNEALNLSLRLDAARAVAPFVYPRLNAIEARIGVYPAASRQLSEAEMRELITVIDAADDDVSLLPEPE
jgi:hypothetical protein